MTRTVEEAAEACLDAISTPDTLRTEARPHLLAALHEARDAALHEAADHLDRIAPYAEDQQTTFTAQGCAREVRLLASSPPPAAPARDDRGAEPLPPPIEDALAAYVKEVFAFAVNDDAGDVAVTVARGALRDAIATALRAASSSGEATALREQAECSKALAEAYEAGRIDGRKAGIEEAARHLRGRCFGRFDVQLIASELEAYLGKHPTPGALAAPSQETETRCKAHRVLWPCSECERDAPAPAPYPHNPAPAPSAAPDTGKEPTND
jgi:hypothetical protein